MALRSYLFVPASRPDRIGKALAAGAGAVIVDLEDAVAPDAKADARHALAAWLAQGEGAVLVRVNAVDTPWFADDLALCAHAAVTGVVLPKAERRADLARVASVATGKRLYPLIETAVGYDAARELAASPNVERLVFGSIDFQVDLGIDGELDELLMFRSGLVLASRRAGVASPVDGVSTAIDDVDALRADVRRSRQLGFGAKLCIHPKQVAVVNAAYKPSAAEVDWARRVLDAAAKSGGAAVAVDGKMVDKPVILKAKAILDEGGQTHASP